MSVAPNPRGEISLQPYYFTSSLFVAPFREDIRSLIHAFHECHTRLQPQKPFELFKQIWLAQGWDWMHFKVFDPPSRETFLNVSLRLFLERVVVKIEPPFTRTVALFGLYTFFNTQPSGSSSSLHSVDHIPISYDHYSSLLSLPDTLTSEQLKKLRPVVGYILNQMVRSDVFHILPHSELGAYNPRNLPREVYLDQNTISASTYLDLSAEGTEKKKGRPTKRDKVKKAKAALEGLDKWLHRTSRRNFPQSNGHYLLEQPPQSSLAQYQNCKEQVLAAMGTMNVPDGNDALSHSGREVIERLRQAQGLIETEGSGKANTNRRTIGVERLQEAVADEKGLLGLVKASAWT
ncbi:hypothetical protein E1B28_000912 [Marasmius oreades]|uniref:Uncharacterized protein n=1 Tax=Marasmius oreades TaxID=181124 RepID=A0A9P7V2H3_9AGAR|nr:uncharacterized protein E1B28_000912 [Marasmius oreades]KAG7099032.1 hypothetical protein E1B28_000912 [Marasmius oreades]